MRIFFLITVLALAFTAVFAWDKEDHEIFDLVAAVEKSEGKGTNFYSWLGVKSSASSAEIGKAYRRKSIQLHPDKNPGVKGIEERFARLGVVSTILRDTEKRKLYDFHYKRGVPTWKGTGYYYDRFRPGFGMVLVFLVGLTSGMHYLVMRLNYKTDLNRVEKIIGAAKQAAWGPKMIPVEGRRKVKVPLGGQVRMDENGNTIPGRTIDMVVEGTGDVYILEASGELTPLDASAAVPPSLSRTWFIALCAHLVSKATGKGAGTYVGNNAADADEVASDMDSESAPGTPNSESSASTGSFARKTNAVPTSKAGGKRRNVPKRR